MNHSNLGKTLLAIVIGYGWITATSSAAEATDRHALLVGCTVYDNLESQHHLSGPANDVPLFRQLLVEKFHFPPESIRELTETGPESDGRPTYANIVREIQRLKEIAKPEHQIVILMGGHGSQVPDDDPDNPQDLEDDGLDEVFLPADFVGALNESTAVKNVIRDDDLRQWLADIRATGAHVWIVLDSCHSGTMTRGNGSETPRQISPSLLVSEEALEAARKAPATRDAPSGPRSRGPAMELSADSVPGSLVATYAALSSEPTFDKTFPDDAPADKKTTYGLLTYTLCLVLNRVESPLTYQELMQHVYQQHQQWGRTFPTPLLEGSDLAREVLGQRRWPGRSRLTLSYSEDEDPRVSGGSLFGLTRGSILAMYPPTGEAESEHVIGYVKVTDVGVTESGVEPIEYRGVLPPGSIPAGTRAEVEFIDYGLRQVRVAFDTSKVSQDSDFQELATKLRAQWGDKANHMQLVDQPSEADWLVRADQRGAVLVPAAGWARGLGEAEGRGPSLFGPTPLDDRLGEWVGESMRRIAQVNNLMRIAEPFDGANITQGDDVRMKVEMLRYRDSSDRVGEVVDPSADGFALSDGDSIGFRVTNTGLASAYITLLFVDSGYGITPFFPKPGTVNDNLLEPGQQRTRRGKVNAKTTGRERMLVFAVKASGPPQDFTWLAQPTVERARSTSVSRSGAASSSLRQLLEFAKYRSGSTRGIDAEEENDCSIRYLSWNVR